MSSIAEERLLTVEDVALTLGVHQETVRRLIRDGSLPAVKLGGNGNGSFRISVADLVEKLAEWRWPGQ